MRKRKRDWPVTVYKYAVDSCAIPQRMWDTVRAMQDLWCQLARLHAETRQKVTDETTKEDKAALWAAFNEQKEDLVDVSPLNWECGPEVQDRFDACCRRAASQKDGGWPRVQGFRSVAIPHRFTSGGLPLEKVRSDKARRFALSSLGTGLVSGTFGLGDDESIAFKAVIHREIPADAIVKKVTWCGRRSVFGWQWSIAITVEVPPGTPRVPTGKSVGVDIGWRKIGDDFIRVAYAVDTDGRAAEYLVPMRRNGRSIKRHNKRFPSSRIPASYEELRQLQEQISGLKDECKAAIAGLISPLPDGFAKMGRRGLLKLLGTLDAWHPAHSVLSAWRDSDLSASKRFAAASEQFARRREWLFENWARQIAMRYDKIVIEGNASVKQMIEKEDQSKQLKRSLRYHQIAATGDFIAKLKLAARKHGAEVIEGECCGTTAICHECGEAMTTGPNQYLVCVNGHTGDREINACKNLLSQIEHPEVWKERLREFKQKSAAKRRRKAVVLSK